MSIDTCYFLLNEIKDYIENDSIKNINCVLFGGEPMINKRVLKFFTLELNKLCRKMKVKLSILLTINLVFPLPATACINFLLPTRLPP